jgi:hypothetical protein
VATSRCRRSPTGTRSTASAPALPVGRGRHDRGADDLTCQNPNGTGCAYTGPPIVADYYDAAGNRLGGGVLEEFIDRGVNPDYDQYHFFVFRVGDRGDGEPVPATVKLASPDDGVNGVQAVARTRDPVPATLSLAVSPSASFGAFTPGVTRTYTTSLGATVTSSAADAALTVVDPSGTAAGHLANGALVLPQLQARVGSGAFGDVGAVRTWSAPVSNDNLSVDFSQLINSNDALRTGTYSKALTFTPVDDEPVARPVLSARLAPCRRAGGTAEPERGLEPLAYDLQGRCSTS